MYLCTNCVKPRCLMGLRVTKVRKVRSHTSVDMLIGCVKINYIFQAIQNIENIRRHSLV